ncbi:MAG TPA: hypothetical protein VM055_03245 [Novosphingobium sp.]|nr:hypothetical protein [Novosphingobium sp.]
MRNASERRYLWRVGLAMSAFLVSLFAARYWVEDRSVDGAPAFLLALLPGLCVASVFWAIGRFFTEQTDEYRRMLLVRQLLFASGLSLSVVTVWGFLADFHLVGAARGFYPLWIFFIALAAGAVFNRVTLGDDAA